ncbi:hypothetical protein ACRAWD_31830 [Caulobacter segnis]
MSTPHVMTPSIWRYRGQDARRTPHRLGADSGRIKDGKLVLDEATQREIASKYAKADVAFVAMNAPFDPQSHACCSSSAAKVRHARARRQRRKDRRQGQCGAHGRGPWG